MAPQVRALGGNGIEHARDAVRDVVLHQVFHEQRRKPDAHHGKQKVEPVDARHVEPRREQQLYLVDKQMQHVACHGCKKSHKQRQQQREVTVGDATAAPGNYLLQHG